MLISGIIAANLSWEAVFYIEGGLAVVWLFLWILLASDNPQTAMFITAEERQYIVDSLNQGKTETKHEVCKSYVFKSIFIQTSCFFFFRKKSKTCRGKLFLLLLLS